VLLVETLAGLKHRHCLSSKGARFLSLAAVVQAAGRWIGVYLTAILYALFLTMCIVGLVSWRRTWLAATMPPDEIVMEPARA
jgi:hypothetical protein